MKISRRHFIGSSGSLFLMGSPSTNVRAQSLGKRNLIVISLKGGMDGLAAVPYLGDDSLRKARPNIQVNTKLKLTSEFYLHPKLSSIHQLWKENKASVIHATSIPYTGRSHFEGQNLMETGGNSPYEYGTGWLGRGIDVAGLEGLAISLPMPILLRSNQNPDNFYPTTRPLPSDDKLDMILASYSDAPLLSRTMKKVINRPINLMEGIVAGQNKHKSADTETLTHIAGEELSRNDGPRIAVLEIVGFDTHASQGGEDGQHADKLGSLDRVFSNLKKGLGDAFDNTLILTLTEFGRTIEQNGGYGTEHGYGSAIIAAGGLLKKAQVYTDWPGLKKKDLFEGRDLNVTLDARSVYCAAMAACFDTDFEKLRREAFFGANLKDVTTDLFNV